jgi:signal transduction histidine kinase
MPARCSKIRLLSLMLYLIAAWNCLAISDLPLITNVRQFQDSVTQIPRTNNPVRLEGVVCWADMAQGKIILQDDSGTALIEMDPQTKSVSAGQKIILEGNTSGGRGGASLTIGTLRLDNDRMPGKTGEFGSISLKKGFYPISVSWFDGNNLHGLDVFCEGPHLARQTIPDAILFCRVAENANGTSNWVGGLNYRAYEGVWPALPDFEKMTPVKAGRVTNFDVNIKPRERYAGLEFDGYMQIQRDGVYGFSLVPYGTDQLFVEKPRIEVAGNPGAPAPRQIEPGEALAGNEPSQWAAAEGTATFVCNERPAKSEMEISSKNGTMQAEIIDPADDLSSLLPGSEVRITGICRNICRLDAQSSVSALWAPSSSQVEILEVAPKTWTAHPVFNISDLIARVLPEAADPLVRIKGWVMSIGTEQSMVIKDQTGEIAIETSRRVDIKTNSYLEVLGSLTRAGTKVFLRRSFCREITPQPEKSGSLPVLTTAEQVKRLKRDEALRGYPVKIRGVITWSGGGGFVLQDSTMGVFVQMVDSGDSSTRRVGDYREIEGLSTEQFSPMILARRSTRLGFANMPDPVRPTWDQLMDGTLDTQYVEIQGVVTAVDGNSMMLLTHDGKLKIDLPEMLALELKHYDNAIIRIRGCLWAVKDEDTHMLKVGEVQIHNASIDVDQAAPADLFAASLKNASELMLFDAKAGAFQQVKVAGQVVLERDGMYYLMNGTNGLRFVTRVPVPLKIGDLVEVVGFPGIDNSSPVLQEALVRPTGHDNLPVARQLLESTLLDGNNDSTLVKINAQLMDLSGDQKERTLELQVGSHIVMAHYARKLGPLRSAPVGSRLELIGVYAGLGGDRSLGRGFESFELLLNSTSDIHVLARPSWWTVGHMLAIVAMLVGILAVAVAWIGLLHRQVEQRTEQLKNEIVVREKAEQQRVVEEERSRIARDLHDDLGSSLTEVSMLADAGAGTPPMLEKADKRFQTIGDKARALVNALDVIVWLVNPQKDVLPLLVGYLGSYAEEYLTAAGLACRLKIPQEIPALRVTAHVRHNVFLAVKETLNNIVRHAHASEVRIEMAADVDQLKIIIADNGQGFDAAKPASGNGLMNLQDRLAGIGGQCQIASLRNGGTTVTHILPLSLKPKI